MVIRLLAFLITAIACYGQAYTLRDQTFIGTVASGTGGFNIPDVRTGLAAQWKCNEGGGLLVHDFSGLGRDADIPSENMWLSYYQACVPYNNVLNFGGNTTSFLNCRTNIAWNFYTSQFWSVALWAAHTNAAFADYEGMVVSENGNISTGFTLRYRDAGGFLEVFMAGAGVVIQGPSPAQMPINQWIFYVVTRNVNTYTMYTNGVVCSTRVDTDTPTPTTPVQMFCGTDSMPGSNRYWRGYMDDIRIYSGYTLSQADVTQLYNRGRACPP